MKPDSQTPSSQFSRRRFFGISSGLISTIALSSNNQAVAETSASLSKRFSILPEYAPKITSAWIPKDLTDTSPSLVYEMLERTTDFSWLKSGDRVLLKIALNSGNPFPATSDPWLVEHLIGILKEKGAGEIWVGDQSGVQSVHWKPDSRKGSSRELCQSAGLLDAIVGTGAKPVFFEENGYEAYFATQPEGNHHWKTPIWITSAVKQVDHIVYVPRVASHVMGDITAGFKLGVGFLREDSRLEFHNGGPNFYAMYEEISQVPEIKERLRLIVTSGRKVISTIGPDFGNTCEPDFGLVSATDDLLAAELLSYAWLQWNRQFQTSGIARFTTGNVTRFRSFINRMFIKSTWKPGSEYQIRDMPVFRPGNIYDHPAIVNYLDRIGGKPGKIQWQQINRIEDPSIPSFLSQLIAV